MDELIVRELEGMATEAESVELRRWREASPGHETRYREVRAVWMLTGTRAEVGDAGEVPTAREILRPVALRKRRQERRGPRTRWMVASAAAAALIVALLAREAPRMTDDAPPAVAAAEVRTGSNDLTTAVLGDGTMVRLGPNTTLRAEIGSEERRVDLDGRAFFAVTHDSERPFRVRSDAGVVQVLGTRFEMDSRHDRVRLLVVDGAVTLTAGDEEAELRAGDLGEASGTAPMALSRVEVPERLLDWMGAWVAFESTPLRQVALELQVRLGIEIEIVGIGLEDRTITGWFSEDDQGEIVTMVCRVAEATCVRDGHRVRMETGPAEGT